MVVKIYITGISGNKEVKKRQQRVLLILDSKNIHYELVDIAEPDNEEQKNFMQSKSTSPGATISDPNPRHPLPPQIFNEDVYCGDYDQFDMANEIDEMEKFLKLAPDDSTPIVTSNAEIKLGNGDIHSEDIPKEANETKNSTEESKDENVPDNNETKNEADHENTDAKVENGNETENKDGEQEEDEEDEDA